MEYFSRNRLSKGQLKVSQDVIATVARLAAEETIGVAGIGKSTISFRHLFVRVGQNNAVTVSICGDVVEISLSILIAWAHGASAVLERVQAHVKADVQEMTGVTVARVNVTAAGIVFPGQQSLQEKLPIPKSKAKARKKLDVSTPVQNKNITKLK